MRTSLGLALANVRGQGRRLVSVLLAITLGIAFVAATLVVSDTFSASLTRDAAGSVGDAAVVVSRGNDGAGSGIPDSLPAAVRGAIPGATTRAVASGVVQQDLGGRQAFLDLESVPRLSATTTLVSGRMPRNPGEIVVADSIAGARSLTAGSTTRLVRSDPGAQGAHTGQPVVDRATVVGILHVGRDVVPEGGLPVAFAADADIWRWSGEKGYQQVYVSAPGDPEQARAAVGGLAAAHGLTVRTGAAEKQHRVEQLVRGVSNLTMSLLVFGVVAVFVAALVIANTFSILVAQRTRQLALVRCIGAERSQVRSSVLIESLLVALVGSLLGVALGVALAEVLVLVSRGTALDLGSLVLSPRALLVPLAVGLVVTVAASVAPARAATRVKPLAALRPEPADRARRVATLRIVIGTVLAVGGGALLVIGAQRHAVMLGVPGGLLSFVGVLMVGPVLVPGLARVVGAVPARLAGVPGRLAIDNAGRNPARAAATASALLVGVTLITMMSVGAATATRAGEDALDKQTPVDAVVSASRSLSAADLGQVRRSSVVRDAVLMTSTEVTLTHDGRPVVLDQGQPQVAVTGTETTVQQVTHRPQFFAGLADESILLPVGGGLRTGDRITVTHGTSRVTVRADVSADHAASPVVTSATLRRLDPSARATAWVRFRDGSDADKAAERLAADVAALPGSHVDGIASQRAEFQRIMDVVLLVVTGLLAIAVLIALVGIGNTLGLSVLERTQESGLLRALGLTRGQLRRMLGLEALTLALVGTVVGLALGTAYGIAGAHALLGKELTIDPQVPWLRLVVIAVIACGAGWLASVIPGRRASRVSPSAALATE